MFNNQEDILIVGLGNIGREYEHTRHNVGFDVVDDIAYAFSISSFKSGFSGEYASFKLEGATNKIYLLKPSTYMNLSGISVREFINYFKIKTDNIIVIHDDMDLDVGTVKARISKSDGGHRGIRSIVSEIKSTDFIRLKVGISHPKDRSQVINFVLSKFNENEIESYVKSLNDAVRLILSICKYGLDKGSNYFYSLKDKEKKKEVTVKKENVSKQVVKTLSTTNIKKTKKPAKKLLKK